MSRLPIRVRVTLAFALAMGIVLAGAGYLLHLRLSSSLDQALNQGLVARASDVSALVAQADSGLRQSRPGPVSGEGEGFAQVLDARGRIFDETPGLGTAPLLSGPSLARARRGTILLGRVRQSGANVRLLAGPVDAQGQQLVVIVGIPLESRDRALATLRGELLAGGPVALILTSLIGYLAAAAALRPVERMRARASAISARHLSERLPVPPSNDEVARLGETLNEMLARIEQAMKRERSFVADASHELRTPLALLRAEVELALDAPRPPEELRAALHSVGEEAERLTLLAEDLLLLARIDEGRVPLRREAVELDALLAGVAARFERRARESGRRIEVECDHCRIQADPLRLEQAIGNLVDNALRHGAGETRLLALRRRGFVEVHVSDEGPGFPADFAPTAFERFSRADDARGRGGAGLGLAIVKAIAESHGGAAGLESRADGGADVWISLPAEPAELRPAAAGLPELA